MKQCNTTNPEILVLTKQEAKVLRAQRKTEQPKSKPISASKRKRDDQKLPWQEPEPAVQPELQPPHKKRMIDLTPPPDGGRGKRYQKLSLKAQEAAEAANAAASRIAPAPAAVDSIPAVASGTNPAATNSDADAAAATPTNTGTTNAAARGEAAAADDITSAGPSRVTRAAADTQDAAVIGRVAELKGRNGKKRKKGDRGSEKSTGKKRKK